MTTSAPPKARLAIVVTHPIQHFVPFYRALAAHPGIELRVLFGIPIGVKSYFDAQMQTEILWQMDMLAGYSSEFLQELPEHRQSSFSLPNSRHLSSRLDAFAPDVVLVYGYSQMNSLRAIAWGRRRNVPVMMISDSERAARNTPLRETIKKIVIPLIYRNFAAFLSVGDNNQAYYRYYGAPAERIFRSPFTIDENAFQTAASARNSLRKELRAQLGIPPDALIMLYVGKLYAGKRPTDLITAMTRLAGAPRIHAVIAGNGEQLNELKTAAAANTHFLGFINVDLLPKVYAAADALVVPSAVDRHPLVCSEAACMGLPMIISDRVGAVGPSDIARSGENAIVYPCGDVVALTKAMETIATDEPLRTRMSNRSRAIFETLDMKQSVRGVIDAMAAVRETRR